MGIRKFGLICLGSLILAGCEQAPTGQVLAVIDGEEITLQEVNNEIAQLQLPGDADPTMAQKVALQRVVDRRLLARAAREEGLDQTPEFFVQERQMIDNLLIQKLSEKLQRAITVPTDSEIEEFAETRPEAFADRKLLQVDQIGFPTMADSSRLTALADDKTMDDVVETLQELGINFQRRNAELDTALLGAARLEQIRALPDGEPFILPGPRITTVSVIIGERAAGRDVEGVRSEVADRMSQLELSELLKARLDNLKSTVEIEYQEGLEPDADADAAADAGAADAGAAAE